MRLSILGAKHAQMGPGSVLGHAAASTATRSERIRPPGLAMRRKARQPRRHCRIARIPLPDGRPTGRQSAKRLHLGNTRQTPLEARQWPLPTSAVALTPCRPAGSASPAGLEICQICQPARESESRRQGGFRRQKSAGRLRQLCIPALCKTLWYQTRTRPKPL